MRHTIDNLPGCRLCDGPAVQSKVSKDKIELSCFRCHVTLPISTPLYAYALWCGELTTDFWHTMSYLPEPETQVIIRVDTRTWKDQSLESILAPHSILELPAEYQEPLTFVVEGVMMLSDRNLLGWRYSLDALLAHQNKELNNGTLEVKDQIAKDLQRIREKV